jgi:hypothetical protein
MDLLGGPAASVGANPASLSGPADAKQIKTWLHGLMLSDNAVLYEDAVISAHVEMQYQVCMCICMYVCTYALVCVYVCMYVWTHALG